MSRHVFQCSGTWVEVLRDGLRITVSYMPTIRRSGLRFDVLDFEGHLMDSYSIHDASPPTDMIEIAAMDAVDAEVRAPWLAEHLRHGILSLRDAEDFWLLPPTAVPGGLYEFDGVRGVLLHDDGAGVLETASGDVPLTQDEVAKLRPVSASAIFIDARQA